MSNGQQQQELVIVLDKPVLDWMLTHMVRTQDTFNVARRWLQPEFFNKPGETVYRMLWTATLGFFNTYNCLPTSELLAATVISQLRAAPDFSQMLVDEVLEFIDYAYPPAFQENELMPGPAIDIIKHFLLERRVSDTLQTAFQPGAATNNAAVPAIVEAAYRQLQQFNAIRSYTRSYLVPMDWEEVAVPTLQTGVEILDKNMNGGTEPREVHVILGPTGVGKTTLGMQLVCAMARRNYTAVFNRVEGATRKLHVFLSYEDEKRSMVVRALAYSARIDKTTLEKMPNYGQLTRRGNLHPYERQIYAAHVNPPGEYERMCEAREWLNTYCEFGDFSGRRTEGEQVRGYGGIAEIRQYLDTITNATELPIGVVAIDWAGRCVRRFIAANGGDIQRQQTSLLSEFVGEAFDQVASPFNCPVFIMHQMKGAVGKSPTKKLSHHDAEGCSTFAVNAWFAFCLGNKDDNTHTCLFQTTKTRRGEGDAGQICFINGRFSEIIGASDRYKVDPITNRIVPLGEHDILERRQNETPSVPQAEQAVLHLPLPHSQVSRSDVDQDFLDG